MSNSALRVLAGAGATSDPVYVDDVFSTFLYDGTGSSQTITNNIDLSGEGGLVWIKDRDTGSKHIWTDTVRGNTKTLWSGSDGSYQERTETTYVTGFTSSGFTVGTGGDVNASGKANVSWTFRKAEGFFDIVTYTPSGSPTNVSHNLGSTPGMIMIKNLTDSADWAVWHRSLSSVSGGESGGSQSTLKLNSSDGISGTGYIQSPTSTQFTVSGSSETGTSGKNYVAYVFGHNEASYGEDSDEVIIKCDKYSGDGGSSNFVDVGFEPQFVLIKKANSSGSNDSWRMFDSMRGVPTGAAAATLIPNSSDEESAGGYGAIDFNATGFTLTSSTGGVNQSSVAYIYMAIRRPHKPASEFAATSLFDVRYGQVATPVATTGFPVDLFIERNPNGTDGNYFFDRFRNNKYVQSNSTGIDQAGSLSRFFDFSNGVMSSFGGATAYLVYSLRRAPGFFDVVAYTGTGSAITVNHNLGVTPELIITKNREGAYGWIIWYTGLTNNQYIMFDNEGYKDNVSNIWGTNSTVATSTTFNNGGVYDGTNERQIVYLFASTAGISKIGTYSGTGNDVNVDCGFSSGARFVVIKKVALHPSGTSGDWYVYDSVRGIVAGDDPFWALNTNTAQTTNTDYIDPLSSGFTVTSSAPAALNTSGGTYLFLAIA